MRFCPTLVNSCCNLIGLAARSRLLPRLASVISDYMPPAVFTVYVLAVASVLSSRSRQAISAASLSAVTAAAEEGDLDSLPLLRSGTPQTSEATMSFSAA